MAEIPNRRFVAEPSPEVRSAGQVGQWRVRDTETRDSIPSKFFSQEGAESFARHLNTTIRTSTDRKEVRGHEAQRQEAEGL